MTIIDVLAICSIELNRIEFPPPLLSSWYLDFGATRLVNDNHTIFSNMQHVSGNNLCSIGGQRHDIAHIGNANIQFSNSVVKSIPHVLCSPIS